MLSTLKSIIYQGAQATGVNTVLLRSSWRKHRLLILCYHGISVEDEHGWCHMHFPEAGFRDRLERIKRANCNVLPLGAAIDLLQKDQLPPRAVAITFDDGFYDFYSTAWPLLREFGYPVTVYLTTYYSEYNEPVFDLMCPYLLWKACGQQFSWPEIGIEPVVLDKAAAAATAAKIRAACQRMDGPEKTGVLHTLVDRLGFDFEGLRRKRMLHIMTPDEAGELAREGVDFQLHGHWHRVSRSRERFQNELEVNRQSMARFGVSGPSHYCYPTGLHLPEFAAWLEEIGVRSAVTCEMGFASPDSDLYALPRLVDSPGISGEEFSSWLSGLASWVPRREYPPDPGQLVETDEDCPAPARP